ncbi:MAG: LrgA-associated membrane protein LrgB, partial [uncultured Propionibacteriaceae bacterium]
EPEPRPGRGRADPVTAVRHRLDPGRVPDRPDALAANWPALRDQPGPGGHRAGGCDPAGPGHRLRELPPRRPVRQLPAGPGDRGSGPAAASAGPAHHPGSAADRGVSGHWRGQCGGGGPHGYHGARRQQLAGAHRGPEVGDDPDRHRPVGVHRWAFRADSSADGPDRGVRSRRRTAGAHHVGSPRPAGPGVRYRDELARHRHLPRLSGESADGCLRRPGHGTQRVGHRPRPAAAGGRLQWRAGL